MTKSVSPLRQHMVDDMTTRNMSPNTQKVYTYAVANFSAFHRRSPDKLGIENIREYRLHLMSRGLEASSINPIIGALRFFYGTTPPVPALGDKGFAKAFRQYKLTTVGPKLSHVCAETIAGVIEAANEFRVPAALDLLLRKAGSIPTAQWSRPSRSSRKLRADRQLARGCGGAGVRRPVGRKRQRALEPRRQSAFRKRVQSRDRGACRTCGGGHRQGAVSSSPSMPP